MNLKVKIKLQTFVCSLLQLDRLEEPGEVLVESSVYWEEAEISCRGLAYNTLKVRRPSPEGGPWVILALGQWRVRVQPQGVAGVTTGVL